MNFNTGKAGTYVAGVSIKARSIELTGGKFNSYLEHDGILDILEKRTQENTLDQDVVESYEKHVKAIYQVGDTKTDAWNTVLGYPIEFIPQANPYEKYSGEQLEMQLLLEEPLPNHTHEEEGGIPSWAVVLGSLLILGVLFLVFRSK